MDTLSIILELLKKEGKKQKDLTDYLGITKNAFTNWKGGNNTSYIKRLPEIAEFFGVSVDYLLGNSTAPTHQPTPFVSPETLTEQEKRLILAYRQNPDMHEAVNKLLDISSDGALEYYRAAKSSENAEHKIVKDSAGKLDKLRGAKKITSIEEL